MGVSQKDVPVQVSPAVLFSVCLFSLGEKSVHAHVLISPGAVNAIRKPIRKFIRLLNFPATAIAKRA